MADEASIVLLGGWELKMGMILCKKHSGTGIGLVSEAIQRDVINRTNTAIGVRTIHIELCEDVVEDYYIDESFVKQELSGFPDIDIVFKDGAAEWLASKVKPVCGLCLSEYLNSKERKEEV